MAQYRPLSNLRDMYGDDKVSMRLDSQRQSIGSVVKSGWGIGIIIAVIVIILLIIGVVLYFVFRGRKSSTSIVQNSTTTTSTTPAVTATSSTVSPTGASTTPTITVPTPTALAATVPVVTATVTTTSNNNNNNNSSWGPDPSTVTYNNSVLDLIKTVGNWQAANTTTTNISNSQSEIPYLFVLLGNNQLLVSYWDTSVSGGGFDSIITTYTITSPTSISLSYLSTKTAYSAPPVFPWTLTYGSSTSLTFTTGAGSVTLTPS